MISSVWGCVPAHKINGSPKKKKKKKKRGQIMFCSNVRKKEERRRERRQKEEKEEKEIKKQQESIFLDFFFIWELLTEHSSPPTFFCWKKRGDFFLFSPSQVWDSDLSLKKKIKEFFYPLLISPLQNSLYFLHFSLIFPRRNHSYPRDPEPGPKPRPCGELLRRNSSENGKKIHGNSFIFQYSLYLVLF